MLNRRQRALRNDRNPEFFPAFPPQSRLDRLARLDFSTRELPKAA
jgi:hypothetical protein